MAKIHWSQWMGTVPFILLLVLLAMGYFITGITVILNLIFVSFLLLIYICTYIFSMNLFEFGEGNMKDDVKLLRLEKDNAAILWAFSSGIGIAFLIPGLSVVPNNPLMAVVGLIMLSIGNLVYEMFYYPRYALLIRKRLIEICLLKNGQKKDKRR